MTSTTTNTADQLAQFVGVVFEDDDTIEVRTLPNGAAIFTTASELVSLCDRLSAENERGQNVYVGPNPRKHRGDGSKAADCDGSRCGRCDSCVSLARNLFADFDNTNIDDVRARLAATQLPPPSLLKCSGRGVHAYWRLSTPVYEMDTWTGFQKDLAQLLGSDPSIHNPSRIMRLPGFLNIKPEKGEPVESYIIEVNDSRYALCDLADAIPHIEPVPLPPPPPTNGTHKSNGVGLLARAAAYLAKVPGAVQGNNGDRDTFRTACVLVNDFRLSKDQAFTLMQEWNSACSPPWLLSELMEKIENAIDYAKNSNGCKADAPPLMRVRASIELPQSAPLAPEADPPVIERPEPLRLAEDFINSYFRVPEHDATGLCRRRGEFWRFNGACYDAVSDETLDAWLYSHIDKLLTIKRDKKGEPELDETGTKKKVPIVPTATRVRETRLAIPSRGVLIGDREDAPFWRDGRANPDPKQIVICGNGLLDLASTTLHPLTP